MLCSFLLLIGNVLSAQNLVTPFEKLKNQYPDNSAVVIAKMDSFINENPLTDSLVIKENKKYQRWRWFWQHKLTNENPKPVGKAMQYFMQNANTQCVESQLYKANWHNIGPKNMINYSNPDTNLNKYDCQGSGHIAALWVHPNNNGYVLAGSNSGGLWRTTDNGTTWSCLTDASKFPAMGITSITVGDPNNPNPQLIYFSTGIRHFNFSAGYGYGIYSSNNGGDTWTHNTAFYNACLAENPAINSPPYDEMSIGCIKYSPGSTSILFATYRNIIFRSTNSGATWSKVYQYPVLTGVLANHQFMFTDIEFLIGNANTIFVTGQDGGYNGGVPVLKSTNGGTTWAEVILPDVRNPILNPSFDANLDKWSDKLLWKIWNYNPNTSAWEWITDHSYTGSTTGTWAIENQRATLTTTSNKINPLCYATDPSTSPGGNSIMYRQSSLDLGSPNNKFKLSFSANIPINCTLKIKNIGRYNENVFATYNGSSSPITIVDLNLTWTSWGQYLVFEISTNANYNSTTNGKPWIDNVILKPRTNEVANVSAYKADSIAILYTKRQGGFSAGFMTGISKYSIANSTFNPSVTRDFSVDGNSTIDLEGNTPYSYFLDAGYATIDHNYDFEVNSFQPNVMYIGNTQLGKSTNGGKTFKPVSSYNGYSSGLNYTHADVQSMVLKSQNTINGEADEVFMGNDGGVSFTNTGAVGGWHNLNGKDLIVTQIEGFGLTEKDEAHLAYGAWDNGLNIKENEDWKFVLTADGFKMVISNTDNSTVIASASGGAAPNSFLKSTNKGLNYFTSIPKPGTKWNSNTPIHFHKTLDKLYCGTSDVYIYDAAVSPIPWRRLSNNIELMGMNAINDYAIGYNTQNQENVVYAVTNQENGVNSKIFTNNVNVSGIPYTYSTLFDKTNGVLLNAASKYVMSSVIIDPKNSNRVWVSMGGVREGFMDVSTYNKNRVFYSADGGNTWSDISQGLSWLPINKLLYINGSDDVIFAATDVGVYVWNKNANTWECFNSGLPICMVSDIDFNYCASRLRISTWGRGMWETDVYNYAAPNAAYTIGNGSTTTSVTWNTPQAPVNENIIIKNKATLNISGITLAINGLRRIIVEPGGKLYITNSTLTNTCRALWGGIEIWGNNAYAQSATYQGTVILNNSTIEHAYVGVHAGVDPDFNNDNYDLSKSGGKITASNTIFKNCQRAVVFTKYDKAANSVFTNCQFLVDDNMLAYFLVHCNIWGISNTTFKSCQFKNTRTTLRAHNGTGLGWGILACESGINVLGTTTARCKFEGLEKGIFTGCTPKPLTVQFTDFTKCIKGLYLEGSNNPLVVENTFEVGNNSIINTASQSPIGDPIHDSYYNYYFANKAMYEGIVLNGIGSFIVENNTLNATQVSNTPIVLDSTLAIRVRNSGANTNSIRRNTMNGFKYACLANDINRNTGTGLGLLYVCNTYSNNYNDITIAKATSISLNSTQYGIHQFQGNTISAGNTFSVVTSGSFAAQHIDYNNVLGISSPTQIFYRYNQATPAPAVYNPTKSLPVSLISRNYVATANLCTDNYCPTCYRLQANENESFNSIFADKHYFELYNTLQQYEKIKDATIDTDTENNLKYIAALQEMQQWVQTQIQNIVRQENTDMKLYETWVMRSRNSADYVNFIFEACSSNNTQAADKVYAQLNKIDEKAAMEMTKAMYLLQLKNKENIDDIAFIKKYIAELTELSKYNEITPAKIWAQGLLYLVYHTTFNNPAIFPENKEKTEQNTTNEPIYKNGICAVYPNPADKFVHWSYNPAQLTEDNKKLYIEIFNANAELVHSFALHAFVPFIMHTATLTNGTYLYKVSCKDKLINNGKLVIIH